VRCGLLDGCYGELIHSEWHSTRQADADAAELLATVHARSPCGFEILPSRDAHCKLASRFVVRREQRSSSFRILRHDQQRICARVLFSRCCATVLQGARTEKSHKAVAWTQAQRRSITLTRCDAAWCTALRAGWLPGQRPHACALQHWQRRCLSASRRSCCCSPCQAT
jgi:hypothetical protein